jgi:hypothetical protein
MVVIAINPESFVGADLRCGRRVEGAASHRRTVTPIVTADPT